MDLNTAVWLATIKLSSKVRLEGHPKFRWFSKKKKRTMLKACKNISTFKSKM